MSIAAQIQQTSSNSLVEGTLDHNTTYYWRVRHQDSKGAWSAYSDETSFTTIDSPSVEVFRAQMELTPGINIVSLPLKTDPLHTASSLGTALKATVVIRAINDNFEAYLPEGRIGTDFPIEMGKGYIVNLLAARTFEVTGQPWGEPVAAAPSQNVPTEPWAFVVAGRIDGVVGANLVFAQVRVTNRRTGQSAIAPISPSGAFIATFVHMSRQSVVAVGDEMDIHLIGPEEMPVETSWQLVLQPYDLARAYLLTRLSATPSQTRLLQNFPNPFNPETWIPYILAEASPVTMRIYDASGCEIRGFNLGFRPAGWYHTRSTAVYWDGRNTAGERVSSGVYWVVMETEDFTATRRLVVLK